MPSLKEKIFSDLKSAMKERKTETVSVLRMLLSQIHNEEIEKKSEISDEEVLKIIKKELKKREQAIAIYEEKKDEEFAAKEKSEMKILEKYLPQMLSEEEIEHLIEEIIQEKKTEKPNLGDLISAVMKKAAGRADGRLVANLVKKKIENL